MDNSQNETPYTMLDFAQEFRDRVGDSSRSVPISYLMTYLNTAFRQVPLQEGLERIFDRHDTWELSTVNGDGTPSASWDLGKMGRIIDIRQARFLKANDGQICRLQPIYLEPDEFFMRVTLPEAQPCGDPQYYTIEQLGGINRLVFDRPPKHLVVLDMIYSAFHPRIVSPNDELLIAWELCSIFMERVIILHKEEATDMSTARAMWEDVDVLSADLKDFLARRKSATGNRRIARSF